MKREGKNASRLSQRGQSLVEIALFLPIFVIVLAGLAEVGQIVIGQNRVSNAARSGARFMANGGENPGMVEVALDTVTQTLELQESSWDIWAIRGTLNGEGNDFKMWTFEHVYGISNTVAYSEVSESQVYQEVLQQLTSNGTNHVAAEHLRVVGTYAVHDVRSFLGLRAIPWLAETTSIKSLSVMRMVGFDNVVTDGCDVFPVAVNENVRSVTEPGHGSSPFPDHTDFGSGSPTPEYREFFLHEDNRPLADAKEGYVFKVERGFGNKEFGWLRWNVGRPDEVSTLVGLGSSPILTGSSSLAWPGNSRHYSSAAADGQPVGPLGRVYGYVEPGDTTDLAINIGDWIAAHKVNVYADGVRDLLNSHIENGRVLRFVVWDQSHDQGSYGEYRASGFAHFRFLGYNLDDGDGWLLLEYINWDESCGQ